MSFVPVDNTTNPDIMTSVCTDHKDWYMIWLYVRDNGNRYAVAHTYNDKDGEGIVPTRKMMNALKRELMMTSYKYDKDTERVEMECEYGL